MTTQPRILFIAPRQMKATPALHRAMALATATGASLHLVAFDYLPDLATAALIDSDAQDQIRKGYLERHRKWLDTQAGHLRQGGIQVTVEVLWGQDALTEALVHARELPATLLIKDLEVESTIKRALFTTRDIKLLRESPCPVHFVSHAYHPLPRRILATVDVSRPDDATRAANHRVITEAANLALQCGAELHLLHAHNFYSPEVSEWGYGMTDIAYATDLFEKLQAKERAAFDEIAEQYSIAPVHCHFLTGHPGSVICHFAAEQDMDIVVIGRTHRHGVEKWLGGTAEFVLYKAPESTLSV